MGFGNEKDDDSKQVPRGELTGREDLSSAAEASAGQGASPQASQEASQVASDEASEVAELRQALAAKEEEARKSFDDLLRQRAELENFKKRARREQAEALRFAAEPLLRDLLPVIDNLERAVQHAEEGANGIPLVQGVSLVLKSLDDVLKQHGVVELRADSGEEFDPRVHEAVGRQPSAGEPNRVVSQQQRGFLLHGRLLRPARVVVSCSEAETEPTDVEKPQKDD